ncbi:MULTISPECIES: glycosyltransferase family 2 protein [Methanobacterium]|uniref:Glycosyltransferase 2-like domain-containing protein n=1 Tax=Methanobacterium bryantii TaxID=2161 RepID=A0A2A2H4E9_METBR|nr:MULTISPECIES: glycosyltransferase family 2 protein [Methanobacterium]OEC84686.1 hypothetical protein A9507_15015 [Methanobacterium sp. A39]PAV04278.1 hypothetical protein ASJ80_05360 [Methanobacterium bryantii]
MNYPRVSIIILNWNGWEDTVECLESIFQINYLNYSVIIVDNNSNDESICKIKEYAEGKLKPQSNFFDYDFSNKPIKLVEYTKNESESLKVIENRNNLTYNGITLIKNDENDGFAEGNNIGIRYALKTLNTDYILLLNNDTVVDKDFLNKLVQYSKSDKNIGIIGPKIYYYDFLNKIQVAGAKINLWMGKSYLVGDYEIDKGQYDEIREVDFISGCCFLVKKEVIDKLGLFNANYHCYWEESDYCLSSKKIGYQCIYYPSSKIWHKGSKSTNKVNGLLSYYMARNRFWFMKKHASTIQYVIFVLYFFMFKFWHVNIDFLFKRKIKDINRFSSGVKDGIKIDPNNQ